MPVTPPYDSRAVARHAGGAHGIVTARTLHAAGLSDSSIVRLSQSGRLHRLYRGVYAVGHTALSREGTWMAAVFAGGEGAVLSHLSAAQLWGITRRRTSVVHVSRPVYRRRVGAIRMHHLRPIQQPERAVTVRDRIPVTTLVRTIIDLAEIMDAEELAFVMHEAAFRFVLDVDEIRRVIAANRRFRGRGVLRRALEMHEQGLAGSRSRFERRVERYLRGRGYQGGRAGYVFSADDGEYELDIAWPMLRIAVEADGAVVHARPAARRKDRERDGALKRAEWRVYRIVDDDFDLDPAGATAELRAALDEGLRQTSR